MGSAINESDIDATEIVAENGSGVVQQMTMEYGVTEFSFENSNDKQLGSDTSNQIDSLYNLPSTSTQQTISNSTDLVQLDRLFRAIGESRRSSFASEIGSNEVSKSTGMLVAEHCNPSVVSSSAKKSGLKIHPYNTRIKSNIPKTVGLR